MKTDSNILFCFGKQKKNYCLGKQLPAETKPRILNNKIFLGGRTTTIIFYDEDETLNKICSFYEKR